MAGGNKQMFAKLRGNILAFPVKIATAIYRGTAVAIDSAGYLIQAGDGAAMKFVGIAEAACTVAQAVASGTIDIRCRRHGIIRMTKNTTSAVTDVGKLVYAHTTHTSSVDALVGLAGATTYDNIVGLVVRREPDTPGGTAYTNNWLMVDITPAPWSAADITTHAALADQTAHTLDGIAPATYAAEAGASPQTITAAQFEDTMVHITTNGVMALTLPAAGIAAGTICRFVKTGTVGQLTITATTLVGHQTASNVFSGCDEVGDSVDVLCIGADSYVIVNVNQYSPDIAYAAEAGSDPETVSSLEFNSGLIHLTTAGTMTFTLPATGVHPGSVCRIVKTGAVGLVDIAATTLIGRQTISNVFYGCYNVGDSVEVLCIANDSYVILGVSQMRTILAKGAGAQTLTDAGGETICQPIVIAADTCALTVDAAAAANLGADVIVCCDGTAATVIVAAGFGAVGAGGDIITLAQGESCHIISDGTAWFYTGLFSVA